MQYSHYPHGFSHGLSVRNLPIDIAVSPSANVFWVDSNIGSNQNKGTFLKPFATLAYAITQCTANQGDIIYLAANHSEDVITAGGIACNVAGITIIFLGEGDDRACINFKTSVAATFAINYANVTVINPRFYSEIDALTGPISISGTDCTIINGEWFDMPAKAATNCIDASGAAARLTIDGWKFHASTTGTQKVSNIKVGAAASVTLKNIDIVGDFSTAPIYVSAAATVLRLENIKVNNTNVGPLPGMNLHANTTGMAKNVDVRVASGTTYVSSVAKLNWDDSCLGYNADGYGGDPIGTAHASSDEGKIDAIQADIGNPSARSNFQTIENMIGIPDAANSNLDDMVRTGFDSTAITSNADGSVMERLEYLQAQIVPDLSGLVYMGACDSGMVASTTSVVCATLAGYGDSFFNTKYYMQVIKNANSVGNPPEREVRQISAYTSSTGTFTVGAFTQNVEASDSIMIIHESLVMLGRDDADNTFASTNVVANADGSLIERNEYVQSQVNKIDAVTLAAAPVAGSLARFIASGGTALGTPLAASKSLINCLGTDGTTAGAGTAASAVSLFGAIGTNEADATTPFSSSNVQSNADGTVLEREEYIQAQVNKIDGVTMAVAPVAGSLARFIASGGTALGTPLADSKSLVNAIGTDGTTAAAGTAASAASVLGAIGTNEADATTPFSSSNVQANADGTVLERQEYIQSQVNKVDGVTLNTAPTAGSLATFIASGGTSLGTALAASKSLVDAVGSNGTTLVYGSGSALGAPGTHFWLKKTVTSSAITFGAPVDITGVSSGGELVLDQVILKTDSTGLAGGTNFQILTNNTKGAAVFFAHAIASLGASVTVDTGGVTNKKTVLTSGKKIQIQNTIADGTGAGTVDIYIKCIRVDAGATVAVV